MLFLNKAKGSIWSRRNILSIFNSKYEVCSEIIETTQIFSFLIKWRIRVKIGINFEET